MSDIAVLRNLLDRAHKSLEKLCREGKIMEAEQVIVQLEQLCDAAAPLETPVSTGCPRCAARDAEFEAARKIYSEPEPPGELKSMRIFEPATLAAAGRNDEETFHEGED